MAAYYVDLAPRHFRTPDIDGLAEQIERDLETPDQDALHLVAEVDGEVASALFARLLPASADAEREIQPDLGERRIRIEYLATVAEHRRQGLAARLVDAAESWARDRGATIAETWTYRPSPLSFPFWTERMGYEERSVNLRKPLD